MLELFEAQDGVIAMRATGLLDAADIERGIAAVDEALNTHARQRSTRRWTLQE